MCGHSKQIDRIDCGQVEKNRQNSFPIGLEYSYTSSYKQRYATTISIKRKIHMDRNNSNNKNLIEIQIEVNLMLK